MAAKDDGESQGSLDPDGPTKQARMLQEAVVGKIQEDDAMDNLVEVEMNLDYAAINVLSQDKYKNIRFPTQEEVINDLHSKFENKTKTRLFSCKDCDRYWWRRVPSRKKVSKCRLCSTRYEAIPRGSEWGICKYRCENCGNEFRGFGFMGNPAGSPCYKCYNVCFPVEVIPSNKRRLNVRTRNTHRCSGHNCWRHGGGHRSGECSHPRSREKKVLVASDKHISSGSTVNTFLSQGSLEERFEPDLLGIPEDQSL